MMHWKRVVACVALMCFASSEKANTTAPTVNATTAPAHPGFLPFLGQTLSESMQHKDTHGNVVYTARGGMSFMRQAPAYLLAAYKGTIEFQQARPNGASFVQVTWLGWNNAAQKHVDRYLIVKELSYNGREISDRCFTYPEDTPPGISDPLETYVAGYALTQYDDEKARYDYDARIGRSGRLHSRLMTGPDGFPPTTAHVETSGYNEHGYFLGFYDFQYGMPQALTDTSVFYEFQNYNCEQVTTFKGMPEACLDSWLALEYECADTPAAEAHKKEAKDVIV